jgi:hypothetical protein
MDIDEPLNKIVTSVSNNTLNKYDKTMIYKLYDCHIDDIKEQLDTCGVAVIPNLIDGYELLRMQEGVWDTIEKLTSYMDIPVDRNDPDTWDNWYSLLPSHDMLLQTFSVGHSQFIWDIRQNPKVSNVFSKIWSCEPNELISSFDAMSFHIPPEITGQGWYDDDDWYHVDAAYTRPEFECVQGFVTGFDINEGDATLTVLEGSHKYHQDIRTKFDITSDNDWFRLNEEQLDFYKENGCNRMNIKASAGSLVLWDSRTVHCGMKPLKTRKAPNFRLVAYMCMTPREWCSENVLQIRRNALTDLYMTSHCPHRPKLFPKVPNVDKDYIPYVPKIPRPNLTELGKKLSGF